jgi:hypothetical protein
LIELLHPDWIAHQIAIRFTSLSDALNQARGWNNQFSLSKFKRIYQAYHNKILQKALQEAEPYVNKELFNIMTPSMKGLYGSAGNGKTSTLLAYTKGKAFELSDGKNIKQFAFSNFQNQVYIWADDNIYL